jgi:hypothetical protein
MNFIEVFPDDPKFVTAQILAERVRPAATSLRRSAEDAGRYI